MLPVVINILLAIHVLVSLFIVLLVLMQRPKNEGLGAAFGGGMTDNLFGAQTTNVLQTLTRWLGGIFFALTLTLSILYVKQTAQRSGVQKRLSEAPPVAPATPAPSPSAASAPVQVGDASVPAADAKSAPAADVADKPAESPKADATPAPAPMPADAAKPAVPASPAPAPAEAAKPAAIPAQPSADAATPAQPAKPAAVTAPAPAAAAAPKPVETPALAPAAPVESPKN